MEDRRLSERMNKCSLQVSSNTTAVQPECRLWRKRSLQWRWWSHSWDPLQKVTYTVCAVGTSCPPAVWTSR